MPTTNLTNRRVDALSTGEATTLWWDNALKGFGVKVTPAGSKVFLLQYRMGGRGAPSRRYTIGKHGSPWNASTARSEAERLLLVIASGADPQAAEKQRQFDEINLAFGPYAERFLAEYGKRNWRPRTFQSRASDLRKWVIPVLKGRSLPNITRRDISAVFDGLPERYPALPRNVFAVTRKLFTWAQQRGDIERSPCEGIKSPASIPSRDRVLDDHELMLVAAYAGELGSPFGPFVHMLLVTGQRREEVAAMTWDEVNQDRREWIIPGLRTKNHRPHLLPLNDIAMRGLDDMAGGKKWPESGLIFSTTGVRPISGYARMKRRLDRLIVDSQFRQKIRPWRLHDLRRTMATNLQRLGVRFEVTEALLNHVGVSRSGVAAVYQHHDWFEEKRAAVDLWNDKLLEMLDGLKRRFAELREAELRERNQERATD